MRNLICVNAHVGRKTLKLASDNIDYGFAENHGSQDKAAERLTLLMILIKEGFSLCLTSQ